ncbi:hypothetical protein ACQZV8_14575, partial [Magnetococcales bacterium HHB-1]
AGGDILHSDQTTLDVDVGGTLSIQSTGSGTVDLHALNTDTLNVSKATLAGGSYAITADSGLSIAQMTGDKSTIALITKSGDLELGDVNVGPWSQLTLTSAGQINKIDDNSLLTGGDLTATATGSLTLNTALSKLKTIQADAVTITEVDSGGDLIIENLTINNGSSGEISVTTQNGDLTISDQGDLTTTGNLTLDAQGTDSVIDLRSTIRAQQNITLMAGNQIIGQVSGDGAEIIASGLTMSVGSKIGSTDDALRTRVDKLKAQANSSTIVVDNVGSLDIEKITTVNEGTILIRTTDSMTITGDINPGTGDSLVTLESEEGGITLNEATVTGGDLNLYAATSILSSGTTQLTGNEINLYAGVSLGSSADALHSDLLSTDAKLSAEAGRDIYLIEDQGDLIIGEVKTGQQLKLTTTKGSITVDETSPINLTAKSASLNAIDGSIGSANQTIKSAIESLNVTIKTDTTSSVPELAIENEGNLEIDATGITIDLGTANIKTSGAMTITGDILFNRYNDAVGERDGITLIAEAGDLTMDGDITATKAMMTIKADAGSIIQNSNSTITSTDGTLWIESNRGGGFTQSDGATLSTGADKDGSVIILSKNDITLSHIEAGTGGVQIKTTGAILDGGDTDIDIHAALLDMRGEQGIGRTTDALDISTDKLAVYAGNSGLYLTEQNDLFIGSVNFDADTSVGASQSSYNVTGHLLHTGRGVDAVITALDGSVTLDVDESFSTSDAIPNHHTVGGTLTIKAQGTGSTLSIHDDLEAVTGTITLEATDRVNLLNSTQLITHDRMINITAASGLDIDGDFSLGDPPGLINITGNQTFEAGQKLTLHLGSTTPATTTTDTTLIPEWQSGYDQIIIKGDVTLDGILDIDLDSAFNPILGDTFDLLFFDSIDGHFDFGEGLFGFGDGSLYLDIEVLDDRLQLVTKERPALNALKITANDDVSADRIGSSFNSDYFGYTTYEVSAKLEITEFIHVDGTFQLQSSRQDLALSDNTTVDAEMWRVGGEDLTAFAGLNGPESNEDAIGFGLTDVNLGMSLVQAVDDDRVWMAAKGLAEDATPVGLTGLDLTGRNISVEINDTASDGTVIDYGTTAVNVNTGTGEQRIDFPASKGKMIRIAGDFDLRVGEFFFVNGSLGFEKSSAQVTLADGTVLDTNMLSVGGEDLNAFVGVGGPYLIDSNNDGVINESDTKNQNSIGLSMSNTDFALGLFVTKSGQSGVEGMKWTALQATAGAVEFVGIPNVSIGVHDIAVNINQVHNVAGGADSDNLVIDFAKEPMKIITGTGKSIDLNMDGKKGELIQVSGDMILSVGEFFHASGYLAFEKSATTLKHADGSDVTVDLITIGGTELEAFVGVGGAYRSDSNEDGRIDQADEVNENARGFSMGGVEFALAFMTPKENQTSVEGLRWMGLEARADQVGFVGLPDAVSLNPENLEVKINRVYGTGSGVNPDDQVIDFASKNLDILIGTGKTLSMDMDGDLGELTRASGKMTLAVADFFHLSGNLGFERSTRTVTLADGTTTVDTEAILVGGTDLDAFAGIRGPYYIDSNEDGIIDDKDQPNNKAIGLSLKDVEFGLGLFFSRATDDALKNLNWMGLKATADAVDVVGIPELTMSVKDLSVAVNQVDGVSPGSDEDDYVIDFSTDNIDVPTGTGTSLALDLDGDKGELTRASGEVTLSVADFFHLHGSLGFEKASHTVTLADGTTADTNVLAVGGKDLDAFAGINGPYRVDSNSDGTIDNNDTPNDKAVGLSLGDVEFGMALFSAKEGQSGVNDMRWLGLDASAGSVDILGIPDVTLSARNVQVVINKAYNVTPGYDIDDRVIDFIASPYEVITGTGSSLELTMEGSDGELLRAVADVDIKVADFFHASGFVGFESKRETITLADGSTVDTDMLTLGGADLDGFVGVGGPYRVDSDNDGDIDDDDTPNSDAMGLSLSNVDLALAMFKPKEDQTGVQDLSWIAMEASADEVAVVGVPDLTLTTQDIDIAINQVIGVEDDSKVINFKEAPLEVATGPGLTEEIDFDGSFGEMMTATADVTLAIGGFIQLTGSIALERKNRTVTLSDQSSVTADVLSIFGQDLSAFAGYKTDNQTFGLEITDVDFALAVANSTEDNRGWYSVDGSAASGGIIGFEDQGLTLTGDTITIEANRGFGSKDGVDNSTTIDWSQNNLVFNDGTSDYANLDMKGDFLRVGVSATMAIGDMIEMNGDLVISHTKENLSLDGTSRSLEVMTFGANDVNATIKADNYGTTSSVSVTGLDLAVAVAYTGTNTDNKRWLAVKAKADQVAANAIDFGSTDIVITANDIGIESNRADGPFNDTVIDFSTTNLTVDTSADTSIVIDYAASQGEYTAITSDLSMKLGDSITLSGQVAFKQSDGREVTLTDGTSHELDLTTVAASGVNINVDAGDIDLAITNASMAMVIGADSSTARYYALKADAKNVSLTGIPGVTISGPAALSYNASNADAGNQVIDFTKGDLDGDGDNDGKMSIVMGDADSTTLDLDFSDHFTDISGALSLSFEDLFDLSGDFRFKVDGTKILAAGSDISAALEIGGKEVKLMEGRLGLLLEANGFALEADGIASVELVDGITVFGGVEVDVNRTGHAVNESITTLNDTITIQFNDTNDVTNLALSEDPDKALDVSLGGTVGTKLYEFAGTLVDQREEILPDLDEDTGEITYSHALTKQLPVIDTSVDDLIGLTRLLSIGNYTQRYLHDQLYPGEALPDLISDLPEASYSEYGASVNGLVDYLEEHWLSQLEDGSGDKLNLAIEDGQFKLSYKDTVSYGKEDIDITGGADFDNLGLAVEGDLSLDLGITGTVDFDLTLDWKDASNTGFNLNELSFQASADVDDLVLAAALGPVKVAIGQAGDQYGTIDANLGGTIAYTEGDFSFTPGNNTLDVDLPLYASLVGNQIGGTGSDQPMIMLDGDIFGGEGLTVTTENLEQFTSFNEVSVGNLILALPEFFDYLESVETSDTFLAQIPFVEAPVNKLLDLSSAFKTSVLDKIDFTKPLDVIIDGSDGQSEKDSDLFISSGATFDTEIEGKFITIGDGEAIIIDEVIDENTLKLKTALTDDLDDLSYTIHEPIQNVDTIQDFVKAIDDSGILPTGVSIAYDTDNKELRVPFYFATSGTTVEADIGFDTGSDSPLTLTTTAKGSLSGQVDGGFDLILDLDGVDGSGTTEIALDNIKLSGGITMDAKDLEVVADIGFMQINAGGEGSDSGVHLDLTAAITVDRDPDTETDGDTRFKLTEITEMVESFRFNLDGDAWARIKGLSLSGGLDLTISEDAELALYVQSPLQTTKAILVEQEIGTAFNLDTYVQENSLDGTEIVVVIPDFGDAFDFKNITYEDIIRGLRLGVSFLEDTLAEQAFFTQDIPVVNRSLEDMFDFAGDFLTKVDQAGATKAATFSQIEAVLEEALGIQDDNTLPVEQQKLSLTLLDEGDLNLIVNFGAIYNESLNFNLDVTEMLKMVGVPAAGLEAFSSLANLIEGGGALDLELAANLRLDIGFKIPDNLNDIGHAEVFLYDYTEGQNGDPDYGTEATFGLRLAGSDLKLQFRAGAIALGVQGGRAVLDRDGDITTDDQAELSIRLDQKDNGAITDDGRFHFGQESLLDSIQTELTGAMDVNLPLGLDISGTIIPLGDPISLKTNPAYGDQGLKQLFYHLTDHIDAGSEDPIVFTYPDIVSLFKKEGGSSLLLDMLYNPEPWLDGIDIGLGAMQDTFESALASDIPIIGDKLEKAGQMIGDFRLGLLTELRQKLSGAGSTVEVIQEILFDTFSRLNILEDFNNDQVITLDDIDVNFYDKDGIFIKDWHPGAELTENIDSVKFDMTLGSTLAAMGIDIPLNIDLPGFDLNVDGGFALDVDWSYDFGFGLSAQDGFYLSTNSDPADPEFEFNVDLYLDGEPLDPDVLTPFESSGRLLFFKASIEDRDRDLTLSGFQPSGIFGGLEIDYTGNGAGRLTLNNILSDPFNVFDVDFGLDAGIRLDMELSIADVQALPKLRGDLVFDWSWSLSEGMSADPSISIEYLRLDVNSYVADFLKPIADKLSSVLEPLRPIIEAFDTTIPGLDRVLDPPTLRGLFDLMIEISGKPAINWAFIDAANTVFSLSDTLSELANSGGQIMLGDLIGLGTQAAQAVKGTQSHIDGLNNWLDSSASDEEIDKVQLDFEAEMKKKLEGIEDEASGFSTTERSGFQILPYIKDINNWLSIFTGGDAVLFTYEMPILSFNESFDQTLATIPVYGPVMIQLGAMGSFGAHVDLSFGFDTYGIRKAMETKKWWQVADGFYVNDWSLPQFVNGSAVAGTGGVEKDEFIINTSLGLWGTGGVSGIQVGLAGELVLRVGADINDIPVPTLIRDNNGMVTDVTWQSDGRIRASEIATMWNYQNGGLKNLFDVSADMDFVLSGIAKVLWKKFKIRLIRADLFEFNYEAPDVQPILAEKDGDILYLNSGDRSDKRFYGDLDNKTERFILSGQDGRVNIEFDNYYQSYSGIKKVVAGLGAGDDLLNASKLDDVTLDITAGAGNDTVLLGSAGGTVSGGSGEDTLTALAGSSASVILRGDDDDDRLTGAFGDDTLEGGTGDDRLVGSTGDDILDGGEGIDRLYGGEGVDTYRFGDKFGSERLSDTQGHSIIDLSQAVKGMEIAYNGYSLEVTQGDDHRVRISNTQIDEIHLGQGNDTLYMSRFSPMPIHVYDAGGSDQYNLNLASAPYDGAAIFNLHDDGGDLDEIVLEQSQPDNVLLLAEGSVLNNNERVNFESSEIERLTIKAEGAQFIDNEILYHGDKVNIASTVTAKPIDLGDTGLRIVADQLQFSQDIQAGHIVFDLEQTLDTQQNLTATHDGYLDLRVHGKGNDLIVNSKLSVASETRDVDGQGWIRLLSKQGDIIQGDAGELKGRNSQLIVHARDHVGGEDAPLLTEVAALTATSSRGSITIKDRDSLTLKKVSDAGAGFTALVDIDDWYDALDPDTALAVKSDNVNLILDSDGSVFGHESGLVTLNHQTLRVTADDANLQGGAESIGGGGGRVILSSGEDAWDYRLGFTDSKEGSFSISSGEMASFSRDLKQVTIGKSAVGNTMMINDLTLTAAAPDLRSEKIALTGDLVLSSAPMNIKADLVTMTKEASISSTKDNASLILESKETPTVEGNISLSGEQSAVTIATLDDLTLLNEIDLTGEGSDLTLKVDKSLDIRNEITVADQVNIEGGGTLLLDKVAGITTTDKKSGIIIHRGERADLHGYLIAGGSIGETEITWSGHGSHIDVKSEKDLSVNGAIMATGDVTLTGGKTLDLSKRAGVMAAGLGLSGKGSTV